MKSVFVIFVSAVALMAAAPGTKAQDADPAYDQPVANEEVPQSADGGYYPPAKASSQRAPKHDKYDWEGRYIGGFIGKAGGSVVQTDPTGLKSNDADTSGFIFGGTMGTNWQYSSLVIGMESDLAVSQLSGEFYIPGASWGCNDKLDGCSTDIGWFGTTRLRAGIAIDNFLPYVTGGVALASVESKYSGSPLVDDTTGIGFGWTAGAGLEVGVANHLSVKAEALYVDLGHSLSLLSTSNFKVDNQFAVVRVGANFKF